MVYKINVEDLSIFYKYSTDNLTRRIYIFYKIIDFNYLVVNNKLEEMVKK